MNHYTRQEAIKLSGLTSSRVSYLDSTGVVRPYKVGSSLKPTCLYSWEQILELRTIALITEDVTLQELRKTVKYLKACEQDGSLHEKILMSANRVSYWILDKPGEIEKVILQISASNPGQNIVINTLLPMSNVITDVWKRAKENNIDKFEERAKTKPKQFVAA